MKSPALCHAINHALMSGRGGGVGFHDAFSYIVEEASLALTRLKYDSKHKWKLPHFGV